MDQNPDPLGLGEFVAPVEDWRESANVNRQGLRQISIRQGVRSNRVKGRST